MTAVLKHAFTGLKLLFVLLLFAIVYFCKYAEEPGAVYHEETGLMVFGFDQQRDRWLVNEYEEHDLGIDGPYIFYGEDGKAEVVSVGGDKANLAVIRKPLTGNILQCTVDNADRNVFSISLKDSLQANPSAYAAPTKLLAISDIEGNFRAFARLLIGNGVVNKDLNWTFGDGHLVLLGDFMDRGENVTQCLWLIYKLEEEARKAGGRVHFILGNHEQLNLQGSIKYATLKYRELRRRLNVPYSAMFAKNTELGRWLRTKNVVEKIGPHLFMHGGMSPEIAARGYSLEDINNWVRQNIDKKEQVIPDNRARDLLGQKGILWYRGLVENGGDYRKITAAELSGVLKAYDAKHMVIGHTVVDKVSTDYTGQLIRIDVRHAEGEPQALMLLDETPFRTNSKGEKEAL